MPGEEWRASKWREVGLPPPPIKIEEADDPIVARNVAWLGDLMYILVRDVRGLHADGCSRAADHDAMEERVTKLENTTTEQVAWYNRTRGALALLVGGATLLGVGIKIAFLMQ